MTVYSYWFVSNYYYKDGEIFLLLLVDDESFSFLLKNCENRFSFYIKSVSV